MMMNKKTVNAVMLCAALLFTTLSCSHREDAKETAEKMNEEKFDKKGEKEADKLVEAYSANLYEVKASENAAMNAATPEVKRLAAMLVQAHTKMHDDVKKLAAVKEVTLPADIGDQQRQHLEKLAEKSGIDYDKAFTEQMKEKHEHALEFYQKIADKCQDPDMKAWAESSLSEVRTHMDMVMSAYNLVKDKK